MIATAIIRDQASNTLKLQVAPIVKALAALFGTLVSALLIGVVQLAWSNQERLVVVETMVSGIAARQAEMLISIREINGELEARREYYDRMNDILRRDLQRDIDDLRKRTER